MALRPDLATFPELSYETFQHSLDREALIALKKIPLLQQIFKLFSEKLFERVMYLDKIANALKVSSEQYPSLHKQYIRMAQALDLRTLPTLFIETTESVNAFTFGMENYTIVICSGLIDIMDEDELLAVIGHELGHVKCDHMLYKTIAYFLTEFGTDVLQQSFPIFGQFATSGLKAALFEWSRKAELSCDRAALLATQNLDKLASALGKLAGFSKNLTEPFNLKAIREQAHEYQEVDGSSIFLKLIKVALLSERTHPHTVIRIDEIYKWAESKEYNQIITGNYRRLTSNPVKTLAPPLETPAGLFCSKCKFISNSDAAFCVGCGGNLRNAQLVCGDPSCKTLVERIWKACPGCGRKLQGAPS